MASSKWKEFAELNEISDKRKLVFWGASTWVEQTLQYLELDDFGVLDNNQNNIGDLFLTKVITKPKTYLEKHREVFIVITTKNYDSVIEELHELGFVMGDDFCVSPVLNNRKPKDDFLSINFDILVSSPEHAASNTSGGGLYMVNSIFGTTKKILSGKGRGLVKLEDGYAWLDMLEGIKVLNCDFMIKRVIELPRNSEAHGLWYDVKTRKLFVGLPGRDSVGICDIDAESIHEEIFISDKWKDNKKDNHHVNDICVVDNSLYISMFSFTGNWPLQAYDGGICEINWKTGEKIGSVVSDIWMPHSLMRIGPNLTYLDSMRGQVIDMNHNIIGQFDYFVRGMDIINDCFAIGVSEHRYPDKLPRSRLNIPLDAGVLIFDRKSKMSKLINMPEINSVHSVLILNGDRT